MVGSADEPAVFRWTDGATFFFRVRVDRDPRAPGGASLRPYGWGFLLDTDLVFDNYEYVILVSGIGSAEIQFAENTSPPGIGDPSDVAQRMVAGYAVPIVLGPTGNVRVEAASSTFGGDADWFLDFGIPLADLAGEGLLGRPLSFIGGTSSSAQSLTLDLAGCDNDARLDNPLEACSPDPIVLDDVDGDGVGDYSVPVDTDGDGLPDGQELILGTAPTDADTDDDGLSDGVEHVGSGPLAAFGSTDPLDPDTDGDGLLDGTEVGLAAGTSDTDPGLFVPDADPSTTTNPRDDDHDDDGVGDGAEDGNFNGAVNLDETDPADADSDGDGL